MAWGFLLAPGAGHCGRHILSCCFPQPDPPGPAVSEHWDGQVDSFTSPFSCCLRLGEGQQENRSLSPRAVWAKGEKAGAAGFQGQGRHCVLKKGQGPLPASGQDCPCLPLTPEGEVMALASGWGARSVSAVTAVHIVVVSSVAVISAHSLWP